MNKRILWISIAAIFIISAPFLILRPLWNSFTGKPSSQFQTYHKPHAYSIAYPKGWWLYESGETTGYEILAIYSYNYRKVTNPGSGFSARQIKIALSILARPKSNQGLQTLEEIVKAEFKGSGKIFIQKALTINGRRAIRVRAVLETEDSVSPVIETFIEYKDHQYVCLTGYYDGAESAAQEIINIQDSFQVLE
ncbi:MAG: hypothetical protein K6U80_05095 [Firmicutes bacterium]|nr:hypothetical protein [Bacillota bacterium]